MLRSVIPISPMSPRNKNPGAGGYHLPERSTLLLRRHPLDDGAQSALRLVAEPHVDESVELARETLLDETDEVGAGALAGACHGDRRQGDELLAPGDRPRHHLIERRQLIDE